IYLGFRIQDAENISDTIGRIEKLAKWYIANSSSFLATEHEIRTFLVIPFLHALGWSSQRIGIEYAINQKKLDLILFSDASRSKPQILIETKRMFEGSVHAIEQAMNYCDNLPELKDVKTFVVTDGLRYWL